MKNSNRILITALITLSGLAGGCGKGSRSGQLSNQTCYSGPSSAFNDSEARTDSGKLDLCYDNDSHEGTASFVDGQTSQTPITAKISGTVVQFTAHACSGDNLAGSIDTATGNVTFAGTVCVLTYSSGQAKVARK